MKSPVVKRSIVVTGHKTSVSVEEVLWSGMKEISRARSMTLSQLVSEIDADRNQGNLSSAIRQFVLEHFKSRAVRLTGELRPRASHAQGLAESSLETR
jgi:predicted DNA-binding ribbon-helix-helix protein